MAGLAPEDKYSWIVLSYCLCIFFIVFFAAYGVVYVLLNGARVKARATAGTSDAFITAKGTQGVWRIAWSFFASAMGSWVITGPANFAVYAGWIGLVFYAIASGMPLVLIAFCGKWVLDRYPDACSLGDYLAWRFGPTAKIYMTFVTLLNMGIFLLAEMTTIGSLFADFVGDRSYPIIIVVGVITSAYTAYGGMLISVVTDQSQAILSILIIFIVCIYLAVEFRRPLPEGFGDWAPSLGPNFYGYSSIFSMPCSLMSATVFSEAVWQRVWASENTTSLRIAGLIGTISVTICVFLCGLFGFLAAWGGLVDWETTNPNLYLFQVFKKEPGAGQATVDNWVAMIVLILATIMNESAIDTLLNGITGTISSLFFRGGSLNYCRMIVFLITIPIVVLATQNYQILTIFTLANMLCTCCFLPVVFGLSDITIIKRNLTENALLFSCSMAILTSTAYGIGTRRAHQYSVEAGAAASFADGARFTWLDNGYAWDYFAVAAGSSLSWLIVYSILRELLMCCGIRGIGISELFSMCIPGFRSLANQWTRHLPGMDPELKALPQAASAPIIYPAIAAPISQAPAPRYVTNTMRQQPPPQQGSPNYYQPAQHRHLTPQVAGQVVVVPMASYPMTMHMPMPVEPHPPSIVAIGPTILSGGSPQPMAYTSSSSNWHPVLPSAPMAASIPPLAPTSFTPMAQGSTTYASNTQVYASVPPMAPPMHIFTQEEEVRAF